MDKGSERRAISFLAMIGEKAIQEAYQSRGFTNRTYNLRDSYGSAVYYNGALLDTTIRYIGPPEAKTKRQGKSGREEVNKFFRDYSPKSKGYDIVVIATMPYAGELELGGGRLKHKYHVMAGARELLERVAAKYGAKLKGLGALSWYIYYG